MPDDRLPVPGIPVAQALAALPLESPDRSAWPALAARLPRRRPTPRWPLAMAAAAALAAVVVLPRWSPTPDAAPVAAVVAPAPAVVAAADLETLMAESAQLEHLLFTVQDDSVASASTALLSLELEDGLQQLDAALADPGTDDPARLRLWQQRVALLRDYAGVEGTRHWLASEGRTLDGALVAAF